MVTVIIIFTQQWLYSPCKNLGRLRGRFRNLFRPGIPNRRAAALGCGVIFKKCAPKFRNRTVLLIVKSVEIKYVFCGKKIQVRRNTFECYVLTFIYIIVDMFFINKYFMTINNKQVC
jgi:hypothetical protein